MLSLREIYDNHSEGSKILTIKNDSRFYMTIGCNRNDDCSDLLIKCGLSQNLENNLKI